MVPPVTRMIRKQTTESIGYSVVDLGQVRHVFASAVPRGGGDLEQQTHDALKTIEAVIDEEGTRGSIVKQAVFLRDIKQVDACRAIMKEFYGSELPATSYIPQAPCNNKLVSIEAMGVGRGFDEVEIRRLSERMVVTRHDGIEWVHLTNLTPHLNDGPLYDRSLDVFQQMAAGLAEYGYDINQVIRTWLYLGDIVGPEADTQRYKELNRARTDFFKNCHFGGDLLPEGWKYPVYPASTGIGADGRGFMASCAALVTERSDVKLVPLENPVQVSAFDYGQCYSPKSPKFARAMVVAAGDTATTFISGTASITDSETQHLGDVVKQTEQTLDNIAALIGEDNFARHAMPGLGATLDDLALVRVYIKHQEDYPKTREVCRRRLGGTPTIYAVADVCRPDLLVEIEGIAFSQRQ